MSIAAKLAAKLAEDDFQEAFVSRLLEPVTEGGKYGDLLKLYELLAAIPDPDINGRPLSSYSDAALLAILQEISGEKSAGGSGTSPGGPRGLDALRHGA